MIKAKISSPQMKAKLDPYARMRRHIEAPVLDHPDGSVTKEKLSKEVLDLLNNINGDSYTKEQVDELFSKLGDTIIIISGGLDIKSMDRPGIYTDGNSYLIVSGDFNAGAKYYFDKTGLYIQVMKDKGSSDWTPVQLSSDESLTTETKTVIGAINELVLKSTAYVNSSQYKIDQQAQAQKIDNKLEETVLHEAVVNTPVWQNQPTYEGNLAFDTSEFYYVTLKNTDGTALPSGQFKLMPMYDKYAEAYETVFTLAGLNTGNSGTLTENLPVEFTSDYKMRTAGVERVVATLNLPMDSNLGKLTIRTTGQFIKKIKSGYFASNFSTSVGVAHYNSGATTTSNSDSDKTIWHFFNNQGDDYKIGKFVDTLELQMNGEESFITHRHSLLRYISYGTTTYKNMQTDSVGFGFILSENTKIPNASSFAVINGYIRNGSVFTVTEVK